MREGKAAEETVSFPFGTFEATVRDLAGSRVDLVIVVAVDFSVQGSADFLDLPPIWWTGSYAEVGTCE